MTTSDGTKGAARQGGDGAPRSRVDLTSRPFAGLAGRRDLTGWRTPAGRWLARRVTALSQVTASSVVLLVTAFLGAVVVTGLAVVFAQVYESVVARDGVAGLDRPVLDWAVAHRVPGFTDAVRLFSISGGPEWMPVVTGVTILVVCRVVHGWWPLLMLAVGVAGSLTMTIVAKRVIGRDRPPLAEAVPPYESSGSFPSGHTLNSIVITSIIVYCLLDHVSSAAARAATLLTGAAYAGAMGLSRVFLGHHWLSDVLGAWLLGLSWVGVLVTAHRLARTHRRYRAAVDRRRTGTPPDATAADPRPLPPGEAEDG